jgi:aspartate racemase
VLWSDPRVPDRTAARIAGGEDPLPALLRGIRGLEAAGCGAIAIPCNTAHGWFEGMQAATALPILHIVDAAAAELARLGVPAGRIGVMGTAGTLAMRLYQHRLDARGYLPGAGPAGDGSAQVTPAIAEVKANRVADAYAPLAEARAAARRARRAGGGAGLHGDPARHRGRPALPFPVCDTIDALARAAIGWTGRTPR